MAARASCACCLRAEPRRQRAPRLGAPRFLTRCIKAMKHARPCCARTARRNEAAPLPPLSLQSVHANANLPVLSLLSPLPRPSGRASLVVLERLGEARRARDEDVAVGLVLPHVDDVPDLGVAYRVRGKKLYKVVSKVITHAVHEKRQGASWSRRTTARASGTPLATS